MISCRTLPNHNFFSSAHADPPKAKTPRYERGVFVLIFALILPSTMVGQSIGQVYASDAAVKGSVREVSGGLEVSNGSVITAGDQAATLSLARGGHVRICPRTNLTVNSSPKGQELMFAMSVGSLDGEYQLPATADAILTPDFRILISGPAKVDVSVGATQNGDACVRSRGEDSYVVVSELMGNDFYRVKPNEQAIFHAGHAKDPEINDSASCGCPVTVPTQIQRADATPPPAQSPTPDQQAAALAAIKNEPSVAATANAASAMPPQSAGQLQVQIDAPMVYQSNGTPPDVTTTLARVHVEHLPWPETPNVAPQPPPPPSGNEAEPQARAAPKKGFFHRFFTALFGSGHQ